MVIQYMDNIIIFGPNKEYLQWVLKRLTCYLNQKLHLKLKENRQILPINIRGVDFIGYKFFYDYVLLRKSTCIKLKHRMDDIQRKQDEKKLINRTEFCRTNSYIGWLLKCNSWRLFEKYIEPILPSLILYHRRIIHKTTTPEVRIASCRRYQRHLYKMKQQIAKEV